MTTATMIANCQRTQSLGFLALIGRHEYFAVGGEVWTAPLSNVMTVEGRREGRFECPIGRWEEAKANLLGVFGETAEVVAEPATKPAKPTLAKVGRTHKTLDGWRKAGRQVIAGAKPQPALLKGEAVDAYTIDQTWAR